jgi:hypothetical protein
MAKLWDWNDLKTVRSIQDATSQIGAALRGVFPALGLKTTVTIDPASLAAGAVAETTVTVTGATTAMGVVVQPPAALTAGLVYSARVSAANTVAIRLYNPTGSAIDQASGSWVLWLLA